MDRRSHEDEEEYFTEQHVYKPKNQHHHSVLKNKKGSII
jgi:hypothetical protein